MYGQRANKTKQFQCSLCTYYYRCLCEFVGKTTCFLVVILIILLKILDSCETRVPIIGVLYSIHIILYIYIFFIHVAFFRLFG